MECRACDASMVDSQCLVKGVVYCMSCTSCAELYVGETERPVRDRFAEHYREARAMVAKAPWGFHYRTQHRESSVFQLSALPPGKDSRQGNCLKLSR